MDNETKIKELVELLNYVKNHLDTDCCQTLMDADSISNRIEKKLEELGE